MFYTVSYGVATFCQKGGRSDITFQIATQNVYLDFSQDVEQGFTIVKQHT